MISTYNQQKSIEKEMSEIKKCPRCNKRKRRLYIISEKLLYTSKYYTYQVLCEECIFLADIEKVLKGDTEFGEFYDLRLDPKIRNDLFEDYKTLREKIIGEVVFRKIIPIILKLGFTSNGIIKPEIKENKITQYRCKECQMTTTSHFEIAKHLINDHEDIPDEKKDTIIEGIKEFEGINLPAEPIFKKLNELTTSWRGFEVLHAFSSIFQRVPFFTNSEAFQETQDIVEKSLSISQTWATFLEEIYKRFKAEMKQIEKSTEELSKRENFNI